MLDFTSDPLSTRKAVRVGGVRRRDETQEQMQQRLYGGQGYGVATEDLKTIFPGTTQNQQMEDPNTNMLFLNSQGIGNMGMSDYQQGFSNYPQASDSGALYTNRVTVNNNLRKRGGTQDQMQPGLYTNMTNFQYL
jgi:hypothetical protein